MLRYLKGIISLRIVWGLDSIRHREKYHPIEIIGYVDSSYTRDLEDRKSITGYCFFFDRKIVT